MNGINNINGSKFGVLGHIGSLPITYYGILVVSGFIIAVIVAAIKLKKFYKVSYDPLLTFAVIAFPVGIFFASVWSYAIGNSSNFYDGFTGNGGLAIQGGVTVATIVGLIFFPLVLKRNKYMINAPLGKFKEAEKIARVSTWIFFDAIVPVVLIGQAVGRWGNFFNYEVFGQVVVKDFSFADAKKLIDAGNTAQLPMKWLYDAMPGVWYNMWIADVTNTGSFAEPSLAWMNAARLHQPLFLYESFFNIIFFTIIYAGFNFIKKYKAGIIGGAAIAYTGVFRLITEPMRWSESGANYKFNQSIVFSALLVTLGILVMLFAYFIAGNKKVRHVAWARFGCDVIKKFLYKYNWYQKLVIGCATLYDKVFKKANATNNRYLEIKKLKENKISLFNYILANNETKYYGSNWVKVFKKRVWVEG